MLACSFHVSPEVCISKIFLKYILVHFYSDNQLFIWISTLNFNLSTNANVKSRTAFVFFILRIQVVRSGVSVLREGDSLFGFCFFVFLDQHSSLCPALSCWHHKLLLSSVSLCACVLIHLLFNSFAKPVDFSVAHFLASPFLCWAHPGHYVNASVAANLHRCKKCVLCSASHLP